MKNDNFNENSDHIPIKLFVLLFGMGLFDFFKKKEKNLAKQELEQIQDNVLDLKNLAEKVLGKSLGLKIDLELIIQHIALNTLKELGKLPFLNTQLKKQGLSKSEMVSLIVFIIVVRKYMLSLVSKKLDANKFWTETGDTISNVLIAQAAQENKEENKIIEGLIISSYKISKKVLNSDTKIFKTFNDGIRDIVLMYLENRGDMPKNFSKKFKNFYQPFAQLLKGFMMIMKDALKID